MVCDAVWSGKNLVYSWYYTLMKVTCFSKISVNLYQNIRRHFPESSLLPSYRRKNLTPHIILNVYCQYHSHILTRERILMFIVKFHYTTAKFSICILQIESCCSKSIIWSGEAISRSGGQDISRFIGTRTSIAVYIRGSYFTVCSDVSVPHSHIQFPSDPS